MGTLRTAELEAHYSAVRAATAGQPCPLCTKPAIKTYGAWKILKNDFPYDRIAKEHDMIVSTRHVAQNEITPDEWLEFDKIKNEYIHPRYEFIIESTNHMKSIPEHFHVHLLTIKD